MLCMLHEATNRFRTRAEFEGKQLLRRPKNSKKHFDLLYIVEPPYACACRPECSACYSYPKLGDWEGDGLEHDLGIGAAGRILSEYAKACVKEVRVPAWQRAREAPTSKRQ